MTELDKENMNIEMREIEDMRTNPNGTPRDKKNTIF